MAKCWRSCGVMMRVDRELIKDTYDYYNFITLLFLLEFLFTTHRTKAPFLTSSIMLQYNISIHGYRCHPSVCELVHLFTFMFVETPPTFSGKNVISGQMKVV